MPRPDQVYHLREKIEEKVGYSQAVRSGNTLYVTGSVSADADGKPLAVGDMTGQLRNAYNDVRITLEAHGATFRNVVKETIYTLDFDDLMVASRMRKEIYQGGPWPATLWVQVARLVRPEFLVEVEVIADLT